jgi:hypothetical protein
MATNRTTVFIFCLVYLIALFFFLGFYAESFPNIDYSSTGQSLGTSVDFLGLHFELGANFISNIVVSVASFPLWINTLFIVLPATLCAIFGILMFIPTIPSG